MTPRDGPAGPAVAQHAAAVVARLGDRLAEVSDDIQELVIGEVAELRGDPQLVQLLRETVTSSVEVFFAAIRHDIPVAHLDAPAAALEYARRLAQRDISVNALVRGYRLGHRAALRAVIEAVRAPDLEGNTDALDPALGFAVYDLIEDVSFDYIDRVTEQVVAGYQDERDQWLQSRSTLRALRVRELLAGGEVDVDAMTTALRYPLQHRHLAVVLWCPDGCEQAGSAALEQLLRRLAAAVDAPAAPLFVAVDAVTGWGWIPLPDAVADPVPVLRAALAADGPVVAAGRPLAGVAGFRRSHRQARAVRAVALGAGPGAAPLIAVTDPGVALAALLGGDVEAAAGFITDQLGALAADTDADARLRRTLLVFLQAGSSYTAAAEQLHLHYNSVKYRVQRAVERRGQPLGGDRLDVEVALLLCDRFGSAVLDGHA
ncbi:helix-turn-helix domain-containing protein [Mycobacterium koreense]|uniref:PucR family transcriptional regulator n=1 Tax=Mycolicibacillus koreensis TaxID=1069220 RepID=A0A7I7SHB1_9MYCO|nr:helix-turn-helix domain-containing protein [Mycolicibacillus koreensis]MCV7250418.1 helix-turn-helix domain-containing protein [Mycolicibacillus koreensis]OSC33326.1 PucR family transcriptional regulator [Mycolicibacillus koreensis]BBY56302.1 ABC transporter substrate-binding protein [Mycolicibacillus koreensis]